MNHKPTTKQELDMLWANYKATLDACLNDYKYTLLTPEDKIVNEWSKWFWYGRETLGSFDNPIPYNDEAFKKSFKRKGG